MTSPFERVAARLDHDAKLPADNWLARRVETAQAHVPSILAVMESIGKMGTLVLHGKISTDLRIKGASNIRSTNPSESVAAVSFGILPTGVYRNWPGRGTWTPDAAMEVGIRLKDTYDYSGPASRGPRPLGRVSLTMAARTWGRLAAQEASEVSAMEGAWIAYGDNGYSRNGTLVQIRREAGQILSATAVETILAPLSRHVIDYFTIMDVTDPGPHQPPGNFTSRSDHVPGYANPRHIQTDEIVSAGMALLAASSNPA